jgi:hypothetical protein
MTRRARQVLDEALKLSPEEGEHEPDATAAWAREIAIRAEQARAGARAAGDWETVCDQIEAELTGK